MVFKRFIRFVLAQAAVTHGMELMTALFQVAQGMVSTIMDASGMTAMSATVLPPPWIPPPFSGRWVSSLPNRSLDTPPRKC